MNRIAKFIIALGLAFFASAFIMSYAGDYIESIVVHRISSFTLLGILLFGFWKLLEKLPQKAVNLTNTSSLRNESCSVQFMFTQEMNTLYAVSPAIPTYYKVKNTQLIPESSIVQDGTTVQLMTMQVECIVEDKEGVQHFIRQQLEQIKSGEGVKVRFITVE
tara:strand:+ start:4783 stop:5268 length:486 start_codon:yes stop_codon:yes gene_type:complete